MYYTALCCYVTFRLCTFTLNKEVIPILYPEVLSVIMITLLHSILSATTHTMHSCTESLLINRAGLQLRFSLTQVCDFLWWVQHARTPLPNQPVNYLLSFCFKEPEFIIIPSLVSMWAIVLCTSCVVKMSFQTECSDMLSYFVPNSYKYWRNVDVMTASVRVYPNGLHSLTPWCIPGLG